MHIKLVHEKLKMFQCDFCPKKCATNDDRQKHMISHLEIKAELPKCDICDKVSKL